MRLTHNSHLKEKKKEKREREQDEQDQEKKKNKKRKTEKRKREAKRKKKKTRKIRIKLGNLQETCAKRTGLFSRHVVCTIYLFVLKVGLYSCFCALDVLAPHSSPFSFLPGQEQISFFLVISKCQFPLALLCNSVLLKDMGFLDWKLGV